MASIVHRNNRFLVVHYEHDISGKNKQKWETYRTLADAKRRKAEIEHRQELGALDVPTCKTVNDLLKEYISLYGKATWSLSVFFSRRQSAKSTVCCGAPSIKLSNGSLWRKIQLSMPPSLRLCRRNAGSGTLRQFFLHSMFVMMTASSWQSISPSRAACASAKFSA